MSTNGSVADADAEAADRVVVSYPADLSDWGRHQVSTRYFRSYLRKTLADPAPGDVSEEFVGVGCCGDTLDVSLRVERVEGGSWMGEETEIEYEDREDWDVEDARQVDRGA